MAIPSLPNIGKGGVKDVSGDFLLKCCWRRCWWHRSRCRTPEQWVIELLVAKWEVKMRAKWWNRPFGTFKLIWHQAPHLWRWKDEEWQKEPLGDFSAPFEVTGRGEAKRAPRQFYIILVPTHSQCCQRPSFLPWCWWKPGWWYAVLAVTQSFAKHLHRGRNECRRCSTIAD